MNDDVVKAIIKTIYDGKGVKEAKQDIQGIQKEANNTSNILNKAFEIGKFAIFAKAIKDATKFIGESAKKSADYIETLNLLEVAFDGNTKSIRRFASSLSDTLNLDDSTVLKSAAHFKVLTQSMGIATETGEKLSELLTKMTLDVSSLYNIDFDKAQTALQYAMEGRGTSLKQRTGVSVLETSVQTTLDTIGVDAYVEDMNDAEKAIARVISMEYQLMSSQGDLARTIEAPANQMRIMGEQIQLLARNIGNVFLPIVAKVLPYLNAILIVINAIISALARLVGYKEGMFDTFEESNTADYFGGVGDAIDGVGKSAEKTAKKLQGLRGFDKLNVIRTPEPTGGSSGGAGGGVGGINPNLLKAFNDMADKYKMKLEGIKTRATEIAEKILGWLGFQKRINEETGKTEWYFKGLGSSSSKIVEHLSSIGDSLADIFNSPKVRRAGEMWSNSFVKTSKDVVNSMAEIGNNMAEGLVGSIDKYLSKNSNRIKDHITNMFKINRENLQMTSALSQSFGEISDIFKNDISKQIGADIIEMFTNPLMSITELLSKWGRDLFGIFAQPIIDNSTAIKETFEGLLEPIQTVTGTMSEAFTYVGDTLTKVYDEHAKPYFDSLKEGLSDTFSKFLEVYNKYFKPFVEDTAKDLKVLWDKNLKPLWDKITELFAALADMFKAFWENVLKPGIDWCVKYILPFLTPVFVTLKGLMQSLFILFTDTLGALIDMLKGVIQFLTGVFTGDWKKAWEGIKNIFKGVCDALIAIFKFPINVIIDVINGFTESLKKIKVPDWVPGAGGKQINIPKIPHLATGGLPQVGQMFIANERGPELVGDIGGQSFVANQNQVLDVIDKKLQNAGGLNNATFIVQVGDEQIAKKVLKDLNGMAKSNGKVITIGG